MSVAFIVVVMFEVTLFYQRWLYGCVWTLPVKVEVGLGFPNGNLRREMTSGIIEVGGIDVCSGASCIDVCIEVVRSDVCIDVVCIDAWY